ncbi:hypothetical protein FRC09_018636, partial [Ceratobasidium sp. 395]
IRADTISCQSPKHPALRHRLPLVRAITSTSFDATTITPDIPLKRRSAPPPSSRLCLPAEALRGPPPTKRWRQR